MTMKNWHIMPMLDAMWTLETRGKARKPNQIIDIEQFIDVKGISAQGNQLSRQKVNQIDLLEPLPYEAPETVHADELEVVDEIEVSGHTPVIKPNIWSIPCYACGGAPQIGFPLFANGQDTHTNIRNKNITN